MRLRSGVNTVNNPETQVKDNDTEIKKSKHTGENSTTATPSTITETTSHSNGLVSAVTKNRIDEIVKDDTRQTQIDGHTNTRNPATRPHGKWALIILNIILGTMILFYFGVPVIIKLFPWVCNEALFLRFVQFPPFIDLNNPQELGLNGTRVFTIPSTGDITLGAWHVLPYSYLNKRQEEYTDSEFMTALQDGKPIMLYLHGHAGTRASWHRRALYKVFSRIDFHVITFDYRGYGDSSPVEPTEEGVMEDGLYVYQWIKENAPKSQVFMWGHSLGTAISLKVASKLGQTNKHLDGLFLEAPFNNVLEGMENFPLLKPFVMMPYFTWVFEEALQENNIQFASDKNIKDVICPIVILHAEDDFMIPVRLAEKLYLSAKDNKQNVKFHTYDAALGYGHKHIHKDKDLPNLIRDFTGQKQKTGN